MLGIGARRLHARQVMQFETIVGPTAALQSACASVDTDCYSLPSISDTWPDVSPANPLAVMAAELARWAYLEEDAIQGNISTYYTASEPYVSMIRGPTVRRAH